jgi:hypothetical protein
MWTIDDIESLNPRDSKQSTSFLEHLFNIGAANAAGLCNGSELLESRDGPYVLAFAQLPVPIHLPDAPFTVRGWREGVTVELRFSVEHAKFDLTGRLVTGGGLSSESAGEVPEASVTQFTQVTGLVRLWTRRAQLHKAYRNCLTPDGLRNDVIGRVGDWMDSPEAEMPLPARQYAPLTAQAFQADVARRVRTEFLRAIHSFIRAYSVASLEDLPNSDTLFGYFVMIAPGRIACASPPIPIVSGLCADRVRNNGATPSPKAIKSLLDQSVPMEDRVVRQLMAMHTLLSNGEPELALIGAVTAAEWFLNEQFGHVLRGAGSRKRGSFSINDFSKAGLLTFGSPELMAQLVALARLRNSAVHGAPPSRTPAQRRGSRRLSADSGESAQEALFLVLEVYRAMNLWAEASK